MASCVLTKEMPTFMSTCRSLVVSKVTNEPHVMPEQLSFPGRTPAFPHVPADENGRSKSATKCTV